MGITIHYSGRIRDTADIDKLSLQLEFAARELGWPFERLDERLLGTADYLQFETGEDELGTYTTFSEDTRPIDDRWRGLLILPPETESVTIAFNRAGELMNYVPMNDTGHYFATPYVFTKTQFSTVDTHIAVCNLLRLVTPYMAEWEVMDEGEYWERQDRERLAELMGFLADRIQNLSEQVDGQVEIGKQITLNKPDWANDWGISAHEN
jgi:hypothetical protein